MADLTCPFCNDDNFDRIGLKLHLQRGWCDAFDETPTTDRPIVSPGEAHAEYTRYGRWSSPWTATHWMPNDPPPAPPAGVPGTVTLATGEVLREGEDYASGVPAVAPAEPARPDDALLIDNLMRAAIAHDNDGIDAARMALRRRFNELRASGVGEVGKC